MNALLHRGRKNVVFAKWQANAAALAMALIALGSQFGAPTAMADSPAPPIPETQVTIKHLGFGISRITLPARAASRLDIRTAEIREDQSGRKVTPFSSIIYDLDGDAWVYTVPESLSFIRESVVVELVKGDDAYLREGPPPGTQVVTVGVPELYGTEVGVNGE
jgi:hypothetical protein